jgi:hypothetical protein
MPSVNTQRTSTCMDDRFFLHLEGCRGSNHQTTSPRGALARPCRQQDGGGPRASRGRLPCATRPAPGFCVTGSQSGSSRWFVVSRAGHDVGSQRLYHTGCSRLSATASVTRSSCAARSTERRRDTHFRTRARLTGDDNRPDALSHENPPSLQAADGGAASAPPGMIASS